MQPRHVIPGFAVSAWRHPYVPAALLTLAMLAACSPRAAEPLADEYLRFPEYVDPPAPRDTLAPVRDLIPWDTVPPGLRGHALPAGAPHAPLQGLSPRVDLRRPGGRSVPRRVIREQ
jgi:hypothetical protein